MPHCADGLSLATTSRLPGVKDLPLSVRGPFAQALMAERDGDTAKAAEKLETAVAAEVALTSNTK